MVTNKNKSAHMSDELSVRVVNANLKSLGKSFDAYKDYSKESLNGIVDMVKEIKGNLKEHVSWEENYHKEEHAHNSDLLNKMQEYIDARHEEALIAAYKAEKKIDDVIKGAAGFFLIIIISLIGYMWNAKENDTTSTTVPEIELTK